MKHSNHEYDKNYNYYDEDFAVDQDGYVYDFDETRIKGMSKKQARRFSSRATTTTGGPEATRRWPSSCRRTPSRAGIPKGC